MQAVLCNPRKASLSLVTSSTALLMTERRAVALPARATGPATREEQSPRRPVLIVEDDVAVSTMLAMALEDGGYEVEVARHGGEALDMLRSLRPCLILLDLRMPVMDGPAFLSAADVQLGANVPPIIVMSAYREIDPVIAERGLPSITKPMNLEALMRVVRSYAECA